VTARRWWPWRRRAFSEADHGGLDLQMPPPYDLRPVSQDGERRRVEQLIASLQGGLDAGSREVLNNLVNDLTDQAIAELRLDRDNRQAVHDILEGLARAQVARHKPRYDADLARVRQAGATLGVTFQDLTGRPIDEVELAAPPHRQPAPIASTLGPLDLSDELSRLAVAEEAQ
jgi:hypothetical protein